MVGARPTSYKRRALRSKQNSLLNKKNKDNFVGSKTLMKIEEMERSCEEQIRSELKNTEVKIKERRNEVIEKDRADLELLKTTMRATTDLTFRLKKLKSSKFSLENEVEKMRQEAKNVEALAKNDDEFERILKNMEAEMTKKVIDSYICR